MADPPAYCEAQHTETQALQTTSHGITLSIPSSPFRPGDVIPLTVSVPASALHSVVGDVRVKLEGSSTVEVMGKRRYQAGQMMNASLGGPSIPITQLETHVFASSTLTVPVSDVSKADKERDDGNVRMEVGMEVPRGKCCSCSGGEVEKGVGWGILPSLEKEGGGGMGLGGAGAVRWVVEVVLGRKGMLKRDVKLSLDVPVSLSLTHIAPRSIPTQSITIPLNYTSNTSTLPPSLSTTLTLLPSSDPTSPLIPFQIALFPTLPLLDPQTLSSPKFKLSVALIRHLWTRGIETRVGDVEGFEWVGVRVAGVSLGRERDGNERAWMRLVDGEGEKEREKEGMLRFEGVLDVGERKSVEGCNLRVKYTVNLQVQWDRLAKPCSISIPVELPYQ